MIDGIIFIVYGEKAENEYKQAVNSLDMLYNPYPVYRFGEDCGAANKTASRYAKTMLYQWSVLDRFLYLDADTRVYDNVKPLFDILADGWDMVMTASTNQEDEAFWHVGEAERKQTYEEIGHIPLQLQCGVMAVAKNERTKKLFDEWHNEWKRFNDEDQAAFVRALHKAPVKIWLMGKPWNGGSVIGHRFGMVR